jgi:hypothetical protein
MRRFPRIARYMVTAASLVALVVAAGAGPLFH